jgi:hypothetical protein
VYSSSIFGLYITTCNVSFFSSRVVLFDLIIIKGAAALEAVYVVRQTTCAQCPATKSSGLSPTHVALRFRTWKITIFIQFDEKHTPVEVDL